MGIHLTSQVVRVGNFNLYQCYGIVLSVSCRKLYQERPFSIGYRIMVVKIKFIEITLLIIIIIKGNTTNLKLFIIIKEVKIKILN